MAAERKESKPRRWALMARRFYDQALVDLESARENVRPRRYHNAVFFAEQAAEKGLKAAHWHLLAEEPTWRHNLEKIAAGVSAVAGTMIPDDVSAGIADLMSRFEISRYPSAEVGDPIPAELIVEADAMSALTSAQRVMTWVEELLRRPIGKPKVKKS